MSFLNSQTPLDTHTIKESEDMEYILTTNNLSKRYGSVVAADKVNLHIRKGEIYGLIGRNGAGKTTVLRMLSRLAIPTSGSYSINGKSGRELSSELSKVGALIETPGLYPNRSALENLKLKCMALGINDKNYMRKLLELVGLGKTGKKKVKEFSFGMKQRLGLALALAGNPDILILDEPINGLDPQGIAEMREILLRLSGEKNITILISSHILDELSKIAHSYGIIHEGRLIDEMTARQLEERCSEAIILRTDDNKKAEEILQSGGITDISQMGEDCLRIGDLSLDTSKIVEKLVYGGVGVKEITSRGVSLEEYYLGLTGGRKNDGFN